MFVTHSVGTPQNDRLAADDGTLLSQTNRQGQTALHIAVISGARKSPGAASKSERHQGIRLLVGEGADPELKDLEGRTFVPYSSGAPDLARPVDYAQGDAEVPGTMSFFFNLRQCRASQPVQR